MYEETHTQVYVSTYELTYDFTAIKAWWSNFMQKVLIYCETWCVQFRFLSLTIPKSYNSMMLESCSYFFAHRLSFCCQCKHSPRAGLEAPELQSWLLTYKWLVLLFPHHLFTHMWWWSWSAPESIQCSCLSLQLSWGVRKQRFDEKTETDQKILWNILCTCIENASLLSVLVTPLEALTKYLTTVP